MKKLVFLTCLSTIVQAMKVPDGLQRAIVVYNAGQAVASAAGAEEEFCGEQRKLLTQELDLLTRVPRGWGSLADRVRSVVDSVTAHKVLISGGAVAAAGVATGLSVLPHYRGVEPHRGLETIATKKVPVLIASVLSLGLMGWGAWPRVYAWLLRKQLGDLYQVLNQLNPQMADFKRALEDISSAVRVLHADQARQESTIINNLEQLSTALSELHVDHEKLTKECQASQESAAPAFRDPASLRARNQELAAIIAAPASKLEQLVRLLGGRL